MVSLWSLMIWAAETVCLAIGTGVAIYFLVVIRSFVEHTRVSGYGAGYGSGHIADVVILMIVMFFMTGYFITSVLVALFLPRDQWFWYPTVIAGLLLIHSLLFFQSLHGGFFNLGGSFLGWAVPLFGTVVAFAVAERGDKMRGVTLPVGEAEGDD